MSKFIEVHDKGTHESLLINLSKVRYVGEERVNSCIIMEGAVIETLEDYAEIRKMIANATGGIPMGKDGA